MLVYLLAYLLLTTSQDPHVLERAAELESRGSFREAYDLLSDLERERPGSVSCQLGKVLFKAQRQPGECHAHLKRCVQTHSQDLDALLLLADVTAGPVGRPDEALSLLDSALDLIETTQPTNITTASRIHIVAAGLLLDRPHLTSKLGAMQRLELVVANAGPRPGVASSIVELAAKQKRHAATGLAAQLASIALGAASASLHSTTAAASSLPPATVASRAADFAAEHIAAGRALAMTSATPSAGMARALEHFGEAERLDPSNRLVRYYGAKASYQRSQNAALRSARASRALPWLEPWTLVAEPPVWARNATCLLSSFGP